MGNFIQDFQGLGWLTLSQSFRVLGGQHYPRFTRSRVVNIFSDFQGLHYPRILGSRMDNIIQDFQGLEWTTLSQIFHVIGWPTLSQIFLGLDHRETSRNALLKFNVSTEKMVSLFTILVYQK